MHCLIFHTFFFISHSVLFNSKVRIINFFFYIFKLRISAMRYHSKIYVLFVLFSEQHKHRNT